MHAAKVRAIAAEPIKRMCVPMWSEEVDTLHVANAVVHVAAFTKGIVMGPVFIDRRSARPVARPVLPPEVGVANVMRKRRRTFARLPAAQGMTTMQPSIDRTDSRSTRRWRLWLLAAVFVAELAHLGWEHLHGGIVSHHLLARRDLPAIWNGWGLVLLPALSWYLSGRVARRIGGSGDPRRAAFLALIGVAAGLLTGALLSVAFVLGREDLAGVILLSTFGLGLLLPAYRAECVGGFVLAMTFVFGAMLPLLIGSVVAAVSAFAHRGLHPLVRYAWKRMRRTAVAWPRT